jgi:hypothetical protein
MSDNQQRDDRFETSLQMLEDTGPDVLRPKEMLLCR